MRKSLLPPAGENLFQRIKKQSAEAASERGVELTRLSIGQPSGPAFEEARRVASLAVLSGDESMHEYQDNGSPGVPNFAYQFSQFHMQTNLDTVLPGTYDVLPIPGIKPMLGVVIESLGSWVPGRSEVRVATMTNPGYGTPADRCKVIKGIQHVELLLNKQNGFLFSIRWLSTLGLRDGDLLMLNFPHNPTGVIATRNLLTEICAYCSDRGIRIFNDGAYMMLSDRSVSTALADVALNFHELNWAEAYSASKAGNNTGWRIGAMIGSPEFIGDIKRVKGNVDSGFVAPMAAGILHLYKEHCHRIAEVRETYAKRLIALDLILSNRGMHLAVKPQAGFFALYDCPRKAFGMDIENADQFNTLMIENTGIVGVPFGKYIRYAVCTTDIGAVCESLSEAFDKAQVSY